MASLCMGSCRVSLFFIFCTCLLFITVSSVEFEVGGDEGWEVPPSKNAQMYNQWASKNRFQVGDTVHFKYKKDSVLAVTDAEYNKCQTSHPLFFSNNGDTIFKLDRPGLFYFISGVAGHCQKGQKMIIKVLEPETPPPGNWTSGSSQKNGAVEMAAISFPSIMLFIMSLLGVPFI